MDRVRAIAVSLLLLLVPVQGVAAACAQLCVKATHEHTMTADPVQPGASHHCDDPADAGEPGGHCCHAQAFMMEPPLASAIVVPQSLEPSRFIARWTSFIPEEPSPPPILA